MAEANMQLYDVAKQLVQNEKPMDSITFTKKVNEISLDLLTRKYSMLLCRERNDFTIFNVNSDSNSKIISKELIPTLRNRGQVILMDKQPDNAWEIWIRDPHTNENFAYYLFDYTNGVIECKGKNNE